MAWLAATLLSPHVKGPESHNLMASLLESLVGLDTLERWNERAQREEAAREGVAYTPPEKREAWRALVP